MSKVYKHLGTNRNYVLCTTDCMKLLRKLPDNSIDLVITSPPYCIGKSYEEETTPEEFKKTHEKVLPEIVRVVRDGGSICWQVGYHVTNGIIVPLDFLVHEVMSLQEGMALRNRIIWTFGFGLNCKNRFSGRHEVVLWYTKGKSKEHNFDLDSVRVPQKYPGKTHYRGKKKGQPSCNPAGKNPGDVWEIPNVKSNHCEKTDHPCQFPVALAQRLVRALSSKDGTVFDPYAGVGSTAVAAILEERKFVGSELKEEYASIARNRMRQAIKGDIKIRPMEKPVYQPDPNTKVAQKPKSVPDVE